MAGEIPPPPPGFTLDAPSGGVPPPPPGFKLDAPVQQSAPDVSATGNRAMDFVAGLGQGAGNVLFPVLNAPNRLFGRVAEPIARGLGLNPPASMTGAGADAQAKAQQKEFQPIDASTSAAGRAGIAGGEATGVGAGMSLALPALGPAALAPGAVPEAILPTVGRALTASPATVGGLVGQTESNALAGAAGEAAKEKSGGNPWMEMLGQMIGGAAPSFFPTSLASKAASAVGAPVGKVGRAIATKAIPESPDFEVRQAERNSYLGRGVGDNGAPLPAPSGKDYSNPATPAPPQASIADRIKDWATNERRQNSFADINQRLDEISKMPEVAANLQRSRELEDQIPGLKLTTAERTGYAPLMLEQKRIEGQMGGDELVGRQKVYDQNQKAIGDFADSRIAPLPQGNADTATGNAARGITVQRETEAAQRAAEAEQGIRNAGAALPVVPQQQSGAQIRQGYNEGRRAANAQTEANKQAIRDEAGNTTFPGDNLNRSLQQDLRNLGTDLLPEEVPPTMRRVIQNTATPAAPTTGQEATFPHAPREAPAFTADDLLEAQKKVNLDIRTAQSAQTPDAAKLQRLSALRDRLQAEERNLGEEGSAVRQRFEEFRRQYRDEFAPNYRQGLGKDIAAVKGSGGQKITDQDVTQRVLANDAATAEQNLRVNPTGVGRQATISANLDDLRRSAVDPKTGMIKEGAVDAWAAKNQDRLAADPELRDLVRARDPQALYDRLNAAHADMSAAKDTEIAKMFGSSGKGAPRSDTRNLDDAFTNPERMRAIKDEAARDPELDAAMKRAVWERAISNPQGLTDKNIQSSLNIAYGDNPQHLRDLKTISDALTTSQQAGRAKGAATEFKPPSGVINDITGSSASSVLNKLWGLNTGRTSKSWLGLDIGLRALNNFTGKDYERALKTAIYNPEVAKLMAAGIKAGRLTPPAQKLLSQYILAAPLASDMREDTPNEITVQPRKRAP